MMKAYAGIDLHGNNMIVAVLDAADRLLLKEPMPLDLRNLLRRLEPWRETLAGIAVESTYNWYWLVDGLMEAGYAVKLVNTAAVPQYEGLKHRGDGDDAIWLAKLQHLGLLPTGWICSKPLRAVRDLMSDPDPGAIGRTWFENRGFRRTDRSACCKGRGFAARGCRFVTVPPSPAALPVVRSAALVPLKEADDTQRFCLRHRLASRR